MDVEKRMSVSLDDIIKAKSSTKQGPGAGKAKGTGQNRPRASLNVGKPGKKKVTVQTNGRLKSRQNLGVQKRGSVAKVQKPRRQVAVQIKKPAKGRGGQQTKTLGSRKNSNPKRIISAPSPRSVQVTITNEKAVQQQRQQYQPQLRANYGYQAPQWGGQAQQQYVPQQSMQTGFGYGPRNLLPREDLSISALSRLPAVPRTRGPADFGVSRRMLGATMSSGMSSAMTTAMPHRPQMSFVDYDNSRTALRMDYGR